MSYKAIRLPIGFLAALLLILYFKHVRLYSDSRFPKKIVSRNSPKRSLINETTYFTEEIIYRSFIGHTTANNLKRQRSKSIQYEKPLDFVIAGVKKCGTSALLNFLNNHPQLDFISLYAYEGHYFNIGCLGLNTTTCLSESNRKKFGYGKPSGTQSRMKKIYGDKTPAYFTTTRSAKLLKLYNKNLKVIVVTCDPAIRALSDYRHSLAGSSSVDEPENYRITAVPLGNQSFAEIVDKGFKAFNEKPTNFISDQVVQYSDCYQNFWQRLMDGEKYSLRQIDELKSLEMQAHNTDPALKIVTEGFYDVHLQFFLDHFKYGEEIILMDNTDLSENLIGTMQKVESFLQLEKFFDERMFVKVKPDEGFYCQNNTFIKQSVMSFIKNITGETVSSFHKNGIVCTSDKPNKSRSLTIETTDGEIAAMHQLNKLYAPSKDRLEKQLKRTFKWGDGN